MNYTFTVFTPVYNRADTIHRVYESLSAQTFRDFQWLVVDDGSLDDSAARVEEFAARADFPVRLIRKENGGKHTAINAGVREAEGELFLVLDSDDECVPQALERLHYHWQSIPAERRGGYSAVTALCRYPDGSIEGSLFPEDVFDSTTFEMHGRRGISGEKWGFQRTDVMREFPFPEFPGEKYVPEGLIWNRIGRRYLTRYVNEALRIYRPQDDGITASIVRILAKSCRSSTLYYNEYMACPISPAQKAKAAVNYVRYCLHGGMPVGKIIGGASKKGLVFAALLPGLLMKTRDLRRFSADPSSDR
jgi:glycosyltransferase involved in cell wall biosynthesis